MAAVRAVLMVEDKSGRRKEVSRLGSLRATASVNTWRTTASVTIYPDGGVYVVIRRDGVRIAEYTIPSENSETPAEEGANANS